MKILLLLPSSENLRIKHAGQRVPRRSMLRFSILPLTQVAALTPPQHKVSICDENVEPVNFDTDAEVIGISFMTAVAPRAYEIAAEFRRRGKIVAAGGCHPTFRPEEAAQFFDSVIIGDAEELWPEFLRDAECGKNRKIYRHERLCSLEYTPPPRRELTGSSRHYITVNAVQTGRGCTHGCKYCSITAFHRQSYRHRPVDNIIDELRGIPRDFIFVDDNIIADRDFAGQLLQAMIPLKKRWVSQCSITVADDHELLGLMRRAGCRGLFIGLETLSSGNLDAVNKSFNGSSSYSAKIARIRSHGIGIVAGIIAGMDGDGVEVFENMLAFLQRTGIDAVQVNIMTPLPGTPLFEEFSQQGRITDYDWNKYDFRHCVITPAGMRAEELQDGADWLYRSFYRLDRILLRFCKSVFVLGFMPAWLGLRLNLTYRYDNIRERISGRNPAAKQYTDTTVRGLVKFVTGRL